MGFDLLGSDPCNISLVPDCPVNFSYLESLECPPNWELYYENDLCLEDYSPHQPSSVSVTTAMT